MKLSKKILLIVFLLSLKVLLYAQPKFVDINSAPGAFSRMGFGPRGMAMGNSISAVTEGNLVAYYNPASSVFQNGNEFSTSYTFLSLDRSLNFLNFTRRFDFYSSKDTSENRKPASTAGLSVGIINSGVRNIDGRDDDGYSTGNLSTSENQFFLAVAIKFSGKFAIGLSTKYYYYKLYQDVTANSLGFDLGAIYILNDRWSFSLVVSDLNSEYKWDSTPVYDEDGTTTENKFPTTEKIGVCYKIPEFNLLTTAEFVNDNFGTKMIRFGIEYAIFEQFLLRGGIDNWFVNDPDQPIYPSLGFAYSKDIGFMKIGVEYAFVIEQYSPSDRHVIGINLIF